MRPLPTRRPLVLLACASLLALGGYLTFGARSAAAQLTITATCTNPPSLTPITCDGWHPAQTRLEWTVRNHDSSSGCDTDLFKVDGSYPRVCSADIGTTTVSKRVIVGVDTKPPDVNAAVSARTFDFDGWFNRPIGFTFEATDQTSGVAACSPVNYAGPDSSAATVTGSCRDNAGNTATRAFPLRYDATPPDVTAAAPDRVPDHAGWFNRPVGFTFQGADALSGLAGCDPVGYGGPDGATATVTGTCRDRAGNVASRGFLLRYDGSAPAVGKLKARPGDRQVRVRWKAPDDAQRFELRRSPGLRGAEESVVYTGSRPKFRDRRVANGRRYEYTLAATDAAGNRARREVASTPGRRLLSPGGKARLGRPPLLRWTDVRGAGFYNVQLYRNGRKVLSRWPSRPRLRLRRTWTYRGSSFRLAPGRYVWYVWPARGSRSQPDFDPAIGRRTFTIVR